LAGNLIVLPALVASPLGIFFSRAGAEVRTRPRAQAPAAGPPAPHLPSGKAAAPIAPAPSARPPHARAVISAADRQDVAHGPHSALHAKLQELRRAVGRESQGSSEA
jgi:hypothetical protein